MNRGFAPLVIVAMIALVAALGAGGAYTVHKVNQLEQENERISIELDEQKQKIDAPIELESTTTDATPDEVSTTSTEEPERESAAKIDIDIDTSVTPIRENLENKINTVQTGNTVYCYGKSFVNNCAEQGRIYICATDNVGCATLEQYKSMKICNGITYSSKCEEGVFTCPAVGEAYCKIPETDTENSVDDYMKQLEAKEEAQRQAAKDMQNSHECREAKEKLADLEEEEDRIQDKLDALDDPYGADRQKDLEYTKQLADLSLKTMNLPAEVNRECYGISGGGLQIDQTRCTSDGYGSIYCTSY